jgi:Domain of unknown function (DUF4917)
MVASACAYLDGHLMEWPDVERLTRWNALLLGNGMSINVWPSFGYDSLFQLARLQPADIRSFEKLGTENFEVVLEALSTRRSFLRRPPGSTRGPSASGAAA